MIVPGQTPVLDRLREVIAETMPAVAEPERLRILGHGFLSIAIETSASDVILIGKFAETAATYARIARFAPRLCPELPARIPQPVGHLPASDHLPGGALCYPKLPGRPLGWADLKSERREGIIAGLARFLLAFHSFAVSQARTLGIPVAKRAAWTSTVEAVLPTLRRILTRQEYGAINAWWSDLLVDEGFWNAPRALRHGDFRHENILTDPDTPQLRSVIDLEYVAISDPACDLATLRHLDHRFADEVAREYMALAADLGLDFDRRVERYWELREFDGLRFAIQYDDPAEFEDGLRALRAGPVLSPLQR